MIARAWGDGAPPTPSGPQAASARSTPPDAPARAGRGAGSGRRLFAFDRELGCRYVAGADEAGRGSLAGPLVAAAVLFDLERLTLADRRALSRLNDSKQHTAETREELYPLVLRAAAAFGDRLALRARHRLPRPARDEPRRPADRPARRGAARARLPGRRLRRAGVRLRAAGRVDGDCRSAAIAAASVLAKVSRDRYMHKAAERHPGLGLRDQRGLLDPGAPRGDRGARRLAAAPHVVPVDRLQAAGARLEGRSRQPAVRTGARDAAI